MPAVSVVLPAFNAADHLEPAVRSILAQDFADFELIALDDGSTDRTAAILDRLAGEDPRVKVIHQPNAGLITTLNRGIEAAQADLIARMDADDIARPGRLARQVGFMNAHPQVVLLGGAYRLVDEKARPIKTMRPPLDDAALQSQCLAATQPICHPLAMLRKSAFVRVGGYDKDYLAAEDLDLFLKLGEIGAMACLDGEPLLDYRMHDQSVSERQQSLQRENQRKAVEAAMKRRGIAGEFAAPPNWRPTDADSRYRWTCTYGWWALAERHAPTARAFGLKAITLKPLRMEGWKLWAKALLARRP